MRSDIIKAEDAELYIYGINQILVAVLNLSSALIIGLIFNVFLEIAIFMAAYIPLRSFAGGFHAKTPLRCYIFSVIMLIIVSIGMNHLYIADWVYFIFLAVSSLIVIILSPVEDKNKPLDEKEHKIYKKRTVIIFMIEVAICFVFKLVNLHSIFVAMVYSFTILAFMLIAGQAKNRMFSFLKQ